MTSTTPTRVAAAAGKRPDIEADLKDKYHVDFSYLANIPTDEFDFEASQANQARFEVLDEETVELYKEGVQRGDAFPAVVAYRQGRGTRPKLVVIDGNHRLEAHHRAGSHINVYEVDRKTKAQTIVLMTFAFNTKHGRPTSEEERIAAALYLIENGATHEAAAGAVSVPLRLLKRALTVHQADRRADEAGIDRREWDALQKAVRSRLVTVSTDEGFKAAAHLAYAAGLVVEETNDLVSVLNTSRSGTTQRKQVQAETDRHRDRIQEGAGGLGTTASKRSRNASPKQRVALMLGQITTLPDDFATVASLYAAPERLEAAARVEDASQKLHKLARELNPSLK